MWICSIILIPCCLRWFSLYCQFQLHSISDSNECCMYMPGSASIACVFFNGSTPQISMHVPPIDIVSYLIQFNKMPSYYTHSGGNVFILLCFDLSWILLFCWKMARKKPMIGLVCWLEPNWPYDCDKLKAKTSFEWFFSSVFVEHFDVLDQWSLRTVQM